MSNETKWTPGPWQVCNGIDVFTHLGAMNAKSIKADDSDGWQVSDCSAGVTFSGGVERTLTYDEMRANAHIVAAAPDLYALLERARHAAADDYACSDDLLEDIDNVLAKARGESHD